MTLPIPAIRRKGRSSDVGRVSPIVSAEIGSATSEPDEHHATEGRQGADHPRRARRKEQSRREAGGCEQAADDRGQEGRLMERRAYGPRDESGGLG